MVNKCKSFETLPDKKTIKYRTLFLSIYVAGFEISRDYAGKISKSEY